jgi:hypothetical protein
VSCRQNILFWLGFDPLHVTEVFGVGEHAAIRYQAGGRQLLGLVSSYRLPGFPASRGLGGDGLLGLCDLLVDAAQAPAGGCACTGSR